MKKCLKKNYNNPLPNNLHDILIGIMLGDGSFYRLTPTSNTRFEMSFGEKYKKFAESIYILFKDYIKTPLKPIEIKGKNKIYINYRLKTLSLPIFNPYFDLFYEYQQNNIKFNSKRKKYIKIIPYNILELMNPIVLAYLIMTDGNFDRGRNRIQIYTNSYTKNDVKRLALAIQTKMDIYVGVLHDRKDQWILTIGATQLPLLRNLVYSNFEPSMLYRIGIEDNNKSNYSNN